MFAILTISAGAFPQNARGVDYTGEKIVYDVSFMGTSEYNDMGVVELGAKKVKLVTFQTSTIGFKDLEKIYCDTKSLLPLRVERDIYFPIGREYIVEEYDPKACSQDIKKYVDNKQVTEYHFKSDGPIHNGVLLPFHLRQVPALKIGWSMDVRLPEKRKVTLTSIDEVSVPAGRFKAFHFTSQPDTFEIWISQDSDRIPLKIVGKGRYGYEMLMRKRTINKTQSRQQNDH